jgi:CHAT domain-containing protein
VPKLSFTVPGAARILSAEANPSYCRQAWLALPHTPGLSELPAAAIEADDFASRFSSAIQLRDADATVEAVREALKRTDEVITLASAFRLAGYRHAIGTLWTISDVHAATIARHVYQELRDPRSGGIVTSGTAAALDAAVLALRRTRLSAPWLWASYIHIGP